MEIVGIVLSIPVAFVANLAYCYFVSKAIIRLEWVRRAMWTASIFVLLAFAVEVVLLVSIGPGRSQALLGPIFYVAHVALFFAGAPALANVLLLRKPRALVSWYWAVPLCTLFAFSLVLMQYAVSEALYGVDGVL